MVPPFTLPNFEQLVQIFSAEMLQGLYIHNDVR